ncbi:hypothetical protein [Caviibacter abscessus]|uniref:hypothetical protein n=1 Tax=Caviibacter abscessus TaxID=1766719 RepID=UPI00082FB004|nr:hypothetical protein [Caviibacter abscessus]
MKYYILIFFILFVIFILLKLTKKQKIIFSKNMFIVNDKYVFDINKMIAPVIKNIKIATDGKQAGIVALELILNYDEEKTLTIKNFNDCKNILVKIKTYNNKLYKIFLSVYPKVIIDTIEKELS